MLAGQSRSLIANPKEVALASDNGQLPAGVRAAYVRFAKGTNLSAQPLIRQLNRVSGFSFLDIMKV